jgi:hypothetical protein
MAKGGARNRSGPPADPNSGRSERRGYKLTELPSEGFTGSVPAFPFPSSSERELEVWEWAWRTPQACAWSLPSESWRVPFVARWVRMSVRAEADDSPASLQAPLMRLEDRIGFSTAGLAEMGWAVKRDEVGEKRTEHTPPEPVRRSSRDRLKVVAASGG